MSGPDDPKSIEHMMREQAREWNRHARVMAETGQSATRSPDRPAGLLLREADREALIDLFALAFIRIRGAHNGDDLTPNGPPCDWCHLAAEQAVEAMFTPTFRAALLAGAPSEGLDEPAYILDGLRRIADWAADETVGENWAIQGEAHHLMARIKSAARLTEQGETRGG